MKPASCLPCTNKNCFVQRFGSAKMMREIDLHKSQSRYRKGEYIITEGSPVTGIYFTYNGKVKVVTEGLRGREHIVRLANNGHLIGHRGIGNEIYPIGAVALEDTVMCFVDNETLHHVFMQYPSFTYEIMMFYSQELRRVEKRIKYISQMTVREKIAEALLYLIDIFGFREKTKMLDIKLSRGDISGLAGTNADQVSRVISDLCKEGILKTQGKYIIVRDHKRLRKEVSAYDQYSQYL
jgi:CRP-like cAMP-binding protein